MSSFIRQPVALLGANCSNWVNFWGTLSPYLGNLFYLKSFHRQTSSTLWLKFCFCTVGFLDWREWLRTLAVFHFVVRCLFIVALSFLGNFHIWNRLFKNTCYPFFALSSITFLWSSCLNLYVCFRSFTSTIYLEIASLNRIDEVTCDKCGTQTTRPNLARHKNRCSGGLLNWSNCPNFSTDSQNEQIYHFAKKHSAPKLVVTLRFRLRYQEFLGLYASRQHRNTQNGFPIKTPIVELDNLIHDVDDMSLEGALRSC